MQLNNAAEKIVNTVKEEAVDSAGHVKSWFNNIRKEGFWDRDLKRKRSRRGAPGAGRGLR